MLAVIPMVRQALHFQQYLNTLTMNRYCSDKKSKKIFFKRRVKFLASYVLAVIQQVDKFATALLWVKQQNVLWTFINAFFIK